MSYLAVLLLFVLDRVFKYVANTQLILNKPVFGWPLDVMLYRNEGIALSLNIPIIIPIITGFVALFITSFLFLKSEDSLLKILLFLTSLGILSNLVDRLFLGYIIDYLKIGNAVINIADAMIVIGIFSYIYYNKN